MDELLKGLFQHWSSVASALVLSRAVLLMSLHSGLEIALPLSARELSLRNTWPLQVVAPRSPTGFLSRYVDLYSRLVGV